MTEAEKGWLAGLFDGEGCVSLGTKKKNWELLLEFGKSRIDLTRVNEDGKLKPLGVKFPNTKYQWGIFEQIRNLNLRGINA